MQNFGLQILRKNLYFPLAWLVSFKQCKLINRRFLHLFDPVKFKTQYHKFGLIKNAYQGNPTNSINDVDEDALLLVPQLIKKYDYPCEEHTVYSADGYILQMHRLPHGKDGPSKHRPAVYLQHGLLCSSAVFVAPGPQNGLGKIWI